MNATDSIYRTSNPFSIMYLEPTSGKGYLKPGLPFYGKLKVEKPDGTPAPGEQIELCRFADRERWNRKRWLEEKIRACKEFTSDEAGIIKFTVPPQTPDITSLRFKVKALRYEKKKGKDSDNKLNQPQYSFTVASWYSPSGSHLQLEPITEEIECGKPLTVKFKYTTGEEKKQKFYYEIMARNFIVDTGSFEHEFLLSEDKFIWWIQGESSNINGQVGLKFQEEKVLPGASSTLKLTASPHSICGIGAVDKSVHILSSDNRITEEELKVNMGDPFHQVLLQLII
ncbi:alpha-2-macroglobulin-like [Limulus polyphemus]|uniref:Alpha-2-macroglobulin-like n=1 Tax=Limulus polyphemus TaxID=6850 RepID=A0ABM1TMM2_LIMPO|nr:alpha-2-macroglobulin-like [Limulus polyphemus]